MEHRRPPAAPSPTGEARPRHEPLRERPHHHSAWPGGRRSASQREAHRGEQTRVLDPPPRRRSHRPLRPTHIARRGLHVRGGGRRVRFHVHAQGGRPVGHHRPETDVRPKPTLRRVMLPARVAHRAVHVPEDEGVPRN